MVMELYVFSHGDGRRTSLQDQAWDSTGVSGGQEFIEDWERVRAAMFVDLRTKPQNFRRATSGAITAG